MKDQVSKWILNFCGPVLTAAWLCGDAPAANADDFVFSALRPGNSVETPLPIVTLNGPDRLSIECHSAFIDPGATARGGPAAIAAGGYHSLALKRDGTVAAWGYWLAAGTTPAGLIHVVAIAAGEYYNLALKANGTVVAWGDNVNGQTRVPPGLSNVAAIAAGSEHALALKHDGTVVAWGYNSYGQTNVPPGLSNVVAIAAGGLHNLALRHDGMVVGWGYNLYGQTTVPVGLSNVVAIAAGSVHSLALRRDGSVVVWGDNARGQTTVPTGLSNVVAIAAGGLHSLALERDGAVVAWGDNATGQTMVPVGLGDVVAIAAGNWHSLALRHDGTVVAWGYNFEGQTTVPGDLNDLTGRIRIDGVVDANRPGTYTLTYWVSDLFGETATTNRSVFVLDTTAPAFVCPTNLVVPCAGTAGVPVFFKPEATDLCSGSVAVSCVPVSGSLFPMGTTAVVCTATDASGNTASCGFTVEVRGARAATEDAVHDLVALKPGFINSRDTKKLDEAIEALNEALNPSLWRDDTHLQVQGGNQVFQQAKASVNALLELIRKEESAIPDEALAKLVECIVKNLRLLAVLEIEEAAAARVDSRKIAEAEEQVITGDKDVATEKWAAGIEHYRNAWHHAVHLQMRIRVSASDGGLRVLFMGLSGRTYVLEASTNLTDWMMVASRTPTWDGMVTIEDSEATVLGARFYRVSSAP